ncbi:hypothetical protein M408DRAFT_22760 [Serendipita vermifera MAFF 305830]|uniref:CoA transferase n=1 Tax=Serendipita vermifera MAFF 305830 TaxID=933852 RepID=A0A0C2XK02_SERVB|nr:hypothetical protein M408DRAFT_22760 [Serendipita vermifera MAFF 305830]
MCVAALRSFAEWDKHPQSHALRGNPPIQLVKIADSPPRALSGSLRPLEGIKVLELTRVLAGPAAGRTLADLGADVLWVTSPQLPSLPVADIDTSRGKRATQLDLTQPEDADKLRDLASGADVFLQSYRPNSLCHRGFSPEELARLRPGIVVANLRGYGWEGPWQEKRAFDSLVQAATGLNLAEGQARAESRNDDPSPKNIEALPVQCLDHGAGQLLAFGIMAALYRSMKEGGSWEVRVSLAGVGEWLRQLGQLDPMEAFEGKALPPRSSPVDEELRPLMQEWSIRGMSSFRGPMTLKALSSPISLEGISVGSSEVPGTLNSDSPTWI